MSPSAAPAGYAAIPHVAALLGAGFEPRRSEARRSCGLLVSGRV